MPLDERRLRIVVAKQAEPYLIRQIRPIVKKSFEEKKQEFLERFEADKVTQELRGGAHASSLHTALSAVGGNLFSLLGFYQEQRPIDELRDFLESNVVLYKTSAGRVRGNKITFDTTVIAPTEDDVNSAMMTQDAGLEWTDRSWTELLANGISGLPSYLVDLTRDFSHIPSRSGPAFQVKGDLRKAKMGKIPYIARTLGVLKTMFPKRR